MLFKIIYQTKYLIFCCMFPFSKPLSAIISRKSRSRNHLRHCLPFFLRHSVGRFRFLDRYQNLPKMLKMQRRHTLIFLFLSLKLLLQVAAHIFLKTKQKFHKNDDKILVIRVVAGVKS